MPSRRNQPVSSLRGRFHCPPLERPATPFARGRRMTKPAVRLPLGILIRLLARKNRLARPILTGSGWRRRFRLPGG